MCYSLTVIHIRILSPVSVLCEMWCCACWSWWNTQSYAACCCTGDTRLSSVSYTSLNFVEKLLKMCVKAKFTFGHVQFRLLCKVIKLQLVQVTDVILDNEDEGWCKQDQLLQRDRSTLCVNWKFILVNFMRYFLDSDNGVLVEVGTSYSGCSGAKPGGRCVCLC